MRYAENTKGRRRSPTEARAAHQKELRRRWRALVLILKAKMETVADAMFTFEQEFFAHLVLPDGQTVGGAMTPQLQSAYETGQMPKLLP